MTRYPLAFDARFAVGRPARTINGLVLATRGTHSTQEECVPPVSTNGLQPSASHALAGRRTRIGMRNETHGQGQMIAIRSNCMLTVPSLLLVLVTANGASGAQTSSSEWNVSKPGVKEVQIPFASLKPSARLRLPKNQNIHQ